MITRYGLEFGFMVIWATYLGKSFKETNHWEYPGDTDAAWTMHAVTCKNVLMSAAKRRINKSVVHLQEALLFTVVSFQAFFSVPVLQSRWEHISLTLNSAIFSKNGKDKLP